jgi:hypothetical protein
MGGMSIWSVAEGEKGESSEKSVTGVTGLAGLLSLATSLGQNIFNTGFAIRMNG